MQIKVVLIKMAVFVAQAGVGNIERGAAWNRWCPVRAELESLLTSVFESKRACGEAVQFYRMAAIHGTRDQCVKDGMNLQIPWTRRLHWLMSWAKVNKNM